MAILNKLPTRDRLERMGICTDGLCINCSTHQETRDHIFSNCLLAIGIWKSILNMNGMNFYALTWDEMVARACSSWKGKSLLIAILKISWNAFIYFFWQERNQRLFQGRFRSADVILKEIVDVVAIRLRDRSINRLDSTSLSLCNA
ncbi:uncharacterized protein LOC120148388 [Hibiscus syriacus]|uniref:uncharacterized protein LOC120148388 n=1 Tax=Hibiscus syriacus TaxID=106335 RepID=UPI001921007C|nr:uncharacterized protein LOC120148388 [Hibiscus syriacus]